MADELGLTVAAYSNIERGVTDISLTRLFQIAKILEANPDYLIHGSSDNHLKERVSPVENYQTSITQQIYMLIQQVQQLQSQLDKMEKEIREIKKP